MLRAARGVLYAIVPVELLVFVLLISGVALSRPLVIVGEAAVLAALFLEFAVAGRLAMAARRNGAGWRAAFRSVEQVLPDPVRRIVAVDTKGLVSLAMFVARRRHGVPAGAVGVAYSRGQQSLQLSFLFAMVVETAAVEMPLRGVKAPEGLRMVVLVVDLYSILIVLAVIAVPDECRRGCTSRSRSSGRWATGRGADTPLVRRRSETPRPGECAKAMTMAAAEHVPAPPRTPAATSAVGSGTADTAKCQVGGAGCAGLV